MKVSVEKVKVEFGEKLRALRESAGLTQEELASHLGKDQQYIQCLEKGKRDIRLSTLMALAIGLKLSPHLLCDLQCIRERLNEKSGQPS